MPENVTPLRPGQVPSYMACTFRLDSQLHTRMPNLLGRRGTVDHFDLVVRKAPRGEGELLALELVDHLNGMWTREHRITELEEALREVLAAFAGHPSAVIHQAHLTGADLARLTALIDDGRHLLIPDEGATP